MNVKNVVTVAKVVFLGVYLVPPVVRGAITISELAVKGIKHGFNKSQIVNDVKKDFELRRQGVITVKYKVI